jgi:hypothetical protein
MKKVILLFATMPLLTWAQSDHCATARIHQEHCIHNHDLMEERAELNEWTKTFDLSQAKSTNITIPVVFHVNDLTNPQKVTLAQVQSAITILNEDFNGANPEFNNLRPEFQGIAANIGISFCLASIDPNGNPTTGITYHYNDYNGREPDGLGTTVKSVESWPNDQYLNIWVVNETEDDGSLYNSGWAFYPYTGYADDGIDGIVYNHRYLGYGEGSSEVSGPSSWQAEMARVLTHEVGHYLNLHHTFENYCSSPSDEVSDTPPVYYLGSNNCDQLGTFCTGVTVVNDENYMDYTPCPSMFTEGQKTRMLAALNSNVAYRNNLWSASNLAATGCGSSGPSFIAEEERQKKELLRIVDLLGQEVKDGRNTPLFYIYKDGSVEKQFILD